MYACDTKRRGKLHSQNSFEHSSGFPLHRISCCISQMAPHISPIIRACHRPCLSVRLTCCNSRIHSELLSRLAQRISIVSEWWTVFNFILYFIVKIQTLSGRASAIYFLVLIFHLFSSSFEFLVFFGSLVLWFRPFALVQFYLLGLSAEFRYREKCFLSVFTWKLSRKFRFITTIKHHLSSTQNPAIALGVRQTVNKKR